jgi:hypothetical protein
VVGCCVPIMPTPAHTCTHIPTAVQVESYMARVVDKMRSELRGILADSARDYPSKPRDKRMYDWPGQIILVSCRAQEGGGCCKEGGLGWGWSLGVGSWQL